MSAVRRLRSARRLGYDGGGDLNPLCRRGGPGVTRTLTQKLGISAGFLMAEVLEEVT